MLTALLALSACAQSRQAKKTTTVTKPVTAASVVAVHMERTSCFGRCPAYFIDLRSNGSASYSGRLFTQHQGIYEKNIGTSVISPVFRRLEANRVDTCKDEYPALVSDLPNLNFSISYSNGTSKQVSNANYGPQFLGSIAKEIDELVKVDYSWKKVADTVN